jgi:excisionase family DNA binding protein
MQVNDLEVSQLLRPCDAAVYLRVSVRGVYKLVATKQITSLRIGRGIRIKRADLDAFLQTHIRGGKK